MWSKEQQKQLLMTDEFEFGLNEDKSKSLYQLKEENKKKKLLESLKKAKKSFSKAKLKRK